MIKYVRPTEDRFDLAGYLAWTCGSRYEVLENFLDDGLVSVQFLSGIITIGLDNPNFIFIEDLLYEYMVDIGAGLYQDGLYQKVYFNKEGLENVTIFGVEFPCRQTGNIEELIYGF